MRIKISRKCNVRNHLLLGNIKLVREICIELKWKDKFIYKLLSVNAMYSLNAPGDSFFKDSLIEWSKRLYIAPWVRLFYVSHTCF